MAADSSHPALIDACLTALAAARACGSPTARTLAEALAFEVGLDIARDLVKLHGFTASRAMPRGGMSGPEHTDADGGTVADDEDGPPRQIQFGTEPIARMLWADLQAMMRAGPLTYEGVARALDKAMLKHIAETARAERARRGQKPN